MNIKNLIFSNIQGNFSAFGLDISDFSIKLVQLEKKRKNYALRTCSRQSIPEGVIKEGEIKREKELIEILKRTISEAKGKEVRTPFAVCSLPEQHGFVKMIKLPKMTSKEAKEAIKWEAEANIPYSLENVYLDWQVIPSRKKLDHLNILVNAVPKNLVNNYLEILKKADIEPIVFEIESVATARSLVENKFLSKPVLIIDLGFSRTSFIIFSGYSIVFTSSIPLCNQEMINRIAEKLGVSKSEAKSLKFKFGLDKTKQKGKVFNALYPSLDKLISQIKDCMSFQKKQVQELQKEEEEINKVILCGGGAYLKGLPEYLSSRLDLKVELGNPWINIYTPGKSKKSPLIPSTQVLAFSTALGLGIRGTRNIL